MADDDPTAGPHDDPIVPYRRLDTAKRRQAGVVYVVMAGVAGGLATLSGVTALWLTAAALLLAIAAYQFLAGWRIQVSDMEAIERAGAAASFSFGHGSATLGFRGPLAKPVWQVLVFADGPTPDHQALVTIDGLSGDVTGIYEETVELP
ncbi:MAG: hypothetical protein BMS9Abin20_0934 [Acidimicrobiia bacterium]|nr:MAG: hypothetical protein BMS9Abin20_0934 [Acidimicrobiia bacterium]